MRSLVRATGPRSGRARGLTLLFGAAAALAVALGSAAPAFAHNTPVSYAPTPDSVVTVQPDIFSVTTNDRLLDLSGEGAGSAMLVTGPAGSAEPLFYGDGCGTVSGATVETKARLGQPGIYVVEWQTVSIDGHSISGTYSFTWQPAAGQTLATGSPRKPTCGSADASPPATDAATSAARAVPLADVAWIVGALGAVALAVVVTLVLTRRRAPLPPLQPHQPQQHHPSHPLQQSDEPPSPYQPDQPDQPHPPHQPE